LRKTTGAVCKVLSRFSAVKIEADAHLHVFRIFPAAIAIIVHGS
jgi:hypothetical protein